MYNFKTSNGGVITSDSHEWNLYDENNKSTIVSSKEVCDNFEKYKNHRVGEPNGPHLEQVTELDYFDECRCLEVDTRDHQFEIITDTGEPVFTHNCQARMVCGRVNTTASMMALGNSLATAIDGDHKGAGIVSVNSVMSNIQYYYERPEWIEKWYSEHGLDKKGYELNGSADDESVNLGEDYEEVTIPENITTIDFEGIHKEINNAKQQEFTELL
jgi:hypothetical protein